jgi:hypothetical protein
VTAKSETLSRRRAVSILGLATLGLAVMPNLLMVSNAEAAEAPSSTTTPTPQAPLTGTQRRQQRRLERTERRQERRTGRVERREERRTGRAERASERRGIAPKAQSAPQ